MRGPGSQDIVLARELRVKLMCDRCGLSAHMRWGNFNRQSTGKTKTVQCCFPMCSGRMQRKRHTSPTPARSKSLRYMASYETAVARRSLRRAASPVVSYKQDDLDSDDEDRITALELRDALDDPGFEPAVDFDPSMRLTQINMSARPNLQLPLNPDKVIGPVQIGSMDLAERGKSTKSVMGNVAAWRFAQNNSAMNAGAYYPGSTNHYEYCHLQGCALGGKTVRANLVAGHYALNTHMMVIENRLQAKTEHWIKVSVCFQTNTNDIADRLEYTVYKNTVIGGMTKLWSTVIDGQNNYFSANNKQEVERSLSQVGL